MTSLSNNSLEQALLASRKRVASHSINVGEKVDLDQAFLLNNHVLRPIQKEIAKQMDSAHQEAQLIIEQAKEQAQQEADEILKVAQDTVEDQRKQLLEEAYENGYLVAQQQAYDEAKIQLTLAYEILAQAQMTRDQILANTAEKVLDIASAISSSIIQYETLINPNILSNLIDQAVQTLSNSNHSQSDCEVVLHPATLDHLLLVVDTQKTPYQFKADTRCPKDKVFLQSNGLRWDISPRNQVDAYVMTIQHQQNLKEFLLEKNKSPIIPATQSGLSPLSPDNNAEVSSPLSQEEDNNSDDLNSAVSTTTSL